MEISDWIALGELLVAVIGIIVGCIGGKELKEANNIKIRLGDIETKIEKIDINNSQVANTINNNGVGVKDVEYVAEKIVDEKTKHKPNVYCSKEEPEGLKAGDFWLQIIDNEK